jgi:SRSO17 transposase
MFDHDWCDLVDATGPDYLEHNETLTVAGWNNQVSLIVNEAYAAAESTEMGANTETTFRPLSPH